MSTSGGPIRFRWRRQRWRHSVRLCLALCKVLANATIERHTGPLSLFRPQAIYRWIWRSHRVPELLLMCCHVRLTIISDDSVEYIFLTFSFDRAYKPPP